MTEELNIIPRWISITQVMQYAPALGRKKIMGHIKKRDFDAILDGGEWIVDRFSVDNYFQKDKKQREKEIEERLARITGV